MLKKLICFPFAGGGASVFHDWKSKLNVDEVIPIVLPGRENKITEEVLTSIDDITECVYSNIKGSIHKDDILILFGYCFGGLVAFEFAKLIEQEFSVKRLIERTLL